MAWPWASAAGWVYWLAWGSTSALAEASASRGSQFIAVISDLEGITVDGGIVRSLALALQRHHHVVVISPFTPWFSEPPEDEPAQLVADILEQDELRRGRHIRREIEKLGIPVYRAGPADALSLLVGRMARFRRMRIGR